MTTMWFKRDILNYLPKDSSLIQVLIGPRQSGKSSFFAKLDPGFEEVSFDDLTQRELAQKDPALFLSQFGDKKLFIDEAQLAPEIFFALKRKTDLIKRQDTPRQTIFRLTGSNQILMDRNVKESLAGRASYFELNTLSAAEILAEKKIPILEILFKGGWPEVHANPSVRIKEYLDNYINTYVEKDIVLSAGIEKTFDFIRFIKILSHRVGNILNFSEIAKEVGVDASTIKDWISVLQQMKLIVLVQPFFSNHSKRLIKSPKVYFIDTGLACRLQGWSDMTPLLNSPQIGGLFESLVFSEIYKTKINYGFDWNIFHWRSREGEEIDFLIEMENQKKIFIEVKRSPQSFKIDSSFKEVRKVFQETPPPLIVCHMEGERILDNHVPIAFLRDYLIKFASA